MNLSHWPWLFWVLGSSHLASNFAKHAEALGRLAEGIYRLKGYTELNHAALRGLLEDFDDLREWIQADKSGHQTSKHFC